MNKYEIIKIIGDGTYGVVYEGKNKITKEKVAIKKLKKKYKSLEECKNKIEIKILETLNHENIVQLKEVIREYNGCVSYIFEYCDCNLLQFIDEHRKRNEIIPEDIIREIILQLTRGLDYLHSKHYLHRDLKPENILLILNDYDYNNSSTNNINNNIKVKIADFGTAKKIPTKEDLTITEYVCTRWYRAPECVLRADYYNETSDIWAIGCIMAELYKLGPIFPGENEFDQINQIFKILGTPTKSRWPWGYSQAEFYGIKFSTYYKKDLNSILRYISKEGINLLNDIFQFEASNRPLCNKILLHPYFKKNPKTYIISLPIKFKKSIPIRKDKKNNYIKSCRVENNYNRMRLLKDNDNVTKFNLIHQKINNKYINKNTLTENPSFIHINKYKRNNNKFSNSFSSKIREQNNRIHKISNCIKIINNSNRNISESNYIKYMTINEKENGIIPRRVFNRNNEESKINDITESKKDYSNIFNLKNERNIENFYTFNIKSKNISFNNDSTEYNKRNIENKSYRLLNNLNNYNNSNYLTLNKNLNESEKKSNKMNAKNFRNFNIINGIQSNNINKYKS